MRDSAWEAQTTTCSDCRHYQTPIRPPGTPPWPMCMLKKGDRMTCGSFVHRVVSAALQQEKQP